MTTIIVLAIMKYNLNFGQIMQLHNLKLFK